MATKLLIYLSYLDNLMGQIYRYSLPLRIKKTMEDMLLRKQLLGAVMPPVKFKGLRMIFIDQLQLNIQNMVKNIKVL